MHNVGVVIVNYNGGRHVLQCLDSLTRSSYRPSATVVVDNASTDGSADQIERRFPNVILIRSPVNEGFAGGVNAGIRWCLRASCDAVFLLNPDAVLEPSALEELVAGADRHPRALLAPMIRYLQDPVVVNSYVGEIVWWRGRMGSRYLGRRVAEHPLGDQRTNTASGCALFVPTEVVREVGMLDDKYFLYFEDADFIERSLQAGYDLWYVPPAVVMHLEGASTGGPHSPLALYYYIRNRHYFVRKFRGGRAVYFAFLAYSVADVLARTVWLLLARNTSLAGAVLRGALDGWRGHLGQRHRAAGGHSANWLGFL